MDDLDGDAAILCSRNHINVGGGAKGVADYQQRHLLRRCLGDDFFSALFNLIRTDNNCDKTFNEVNATHLFSVCQDHLSPVELFEFLLPASKDGSVGFQVDAVTPLDDLQALDSDVLGVAQAETDEIQHDAQLPCGLFVLIEFARRSCHTEEKNQRWQRGAQCKGHSWCNQEGSLTGLPTWSGLGDLAK